jgi:NAD(P)-dependent dehydrogenase (short-subunit alcohol dehydrogenase family)
MKIESGQVAVITGGASGIGFGLAAALGSRGVKVMISDVREDALRQAVGDLRQAGYEVDGTRTDVSDPNAVQALAQAVLDRFDRVDLVFNNAGVAIPQKAMWEQDLDTWNRLIAIKFMGVVYGVRAFAPLLAAQGTGHIVNTASSGGVMPLPTMTPYNGTMHAVVGMTESLNLELKAVSPGLGATVLCPGLVATGLAENSATLGFAVAAESSGAETTFGDVLSVEQVAEATLAAIEADRVHVIPGKGIYEMVRQRALSVLEDLEVSNS